jgi:hypothetical protein
MKQLIIFLIVTALLTVAGNFYFEYCVNRDMPTLYSYPITVVMIVLGAYYLRYLAKTIINLLKLKKQ